LRLIITTKTSETVILYHRKQGKSNKKNRSEQPAAVEGINQPLQLFSGGYREITTVIKTGLSCRKQEA
jgi:hypothetical protein